MNLSVDHRNRLPYLAWIFIALAIIAYTLPWVHNPAVSLSLGAYDLAEWASIHPASRNSSPILFTSLLLRLPLVALAVAAACIGNRPFISRGWWLAAIGSLSFAIALLPPLEYLTHPTGDPNYDQQITLASIALLGSLLGLSGRFRNGTMIIYAVFVIVCGVAALVGQTQAYTLMYRFRLPVQSGLSTLAFCVLCVGIATILYQQSRLPGIFNQTR